MSEPDVLSMESLMAGIEYLKSPEYAEKVKRDQRASIEGQETVRHLYEQGRIDEEEMCELLCSVNINGGLFISPQCARRLGVL